MRAAWEALLLDWHATLKAEHRSPRTITAYDLAVRQLIDNLESRDRLVDLREVTRADVQAFITTMLESARPRRRTRATGRSSSGSGG